VSQLLPAGFNLVDAPYPFFEAIKTATVFLSWQENMDKKDVPPKRIWFNGKALDAHFKAVDRRREAEAKGQGNDEGWDGEMKQNDAASMLLVDDDE
jgi:hypothetical protein